MRGHVQRPDLGWPSRSGPAPRRGRGENRRPESYAGDRPSRLSPDPCGWIFCWSETSIGKPMSNVVEIKTRPAEVIASVIERLEEALEKARAGDVVTVG